MNVLCRTASPFFATRNQLQLDHALRSKVHGNNPIQILCRRGHEYADAFLKRVEHLRSPNELWNMRRTDFLFALRDQHKIHWHLLSSAADRMQRGEKCCLWSFLVHSAP